MSESIEKNLMAKYKSLIDRVVQATHQGKIAWRETANEEAFLARIGNNTILLSFDRSLNTRGFIVEITDMSGKVVDDFNSRFLDEGDPKRAYYGKLAKLHRHVKRELSGADRILDEILQELPEVDEIPF